MKLIRKTCKTVINLLFNTILFTALQNSAWALQPELISKPEDPYFFGVSGSGVAQECSIDPSHAYVVFGSSAANLVAQDNNGFKDIFLLERSSGTLTRITENANGEGGNDLGQYPVISGNGQYAAFFSWASNLVSGDTNNAADIFRYDIQSQTLERVSLGPGNTQITVGVDSSNPSMTTDGSQIIFITNEALEAQDNNGKDDPYLRDINTGTLTNLAVSTAGDRADGPTYNALISGQGNYAALESAATNLDGVDTLGYNDIFVRNLTTGTTTRVLGLSGAEPNGSSDLWGISDDGSKVLFSSDADNLVANDTNGVTDVFVYDVNTQMVTRVSVDSTGQQGNGRSERAAMDHTGRFVAFASLASNLHADDTDTSFDIFVHDLTNHQTRLVSYNAGNTQSITESANLPCIAYNEGNGNVFVGFSTSDTLGFSEDKNRMSDIFIRNVQANQYFWVSDADSNAPYPTYTGVTESFAPVSSFNGNKIAFRTTAINLLDGKSSFFPQIVLLNRESMSYQTISIDSMGNLGDDTSYSPSVNAAGDQVAYESDASNLVSDDTNNAIDIFVYTRTGTTIRASVSSSGTQANSDSRDPMLAAEQDMVVFTSYAGNLINNDTNNKQDIFVHDWNSGITERVNLRSNGDESTANAFNPSISADGRYVVFESYDDAMVNSDNNGGRDVFLRDRQTGTTTLVSQNTAGAIGDAESYDAMISADGNWVVFTSLATNFSNLAVSGHPRVYIRDLAQGTTELAFPLLVDFSDPVISHDGRFVAGKGMLPNPDGYNVYVYDRLNDRIWTASSTTDGQDRVLDPLNNISISGNGFLTLFDTSAGNLSDLDNNGYSDIYGTDVERMQIDSFE